MNDAGTTPSRLFGAAAIVGPALLIVGAVAFANGGGLNQDGTGGALYVYAFIAMTLAAIGIAREVEHALPRASAALLAVAVLGCAGGVGFGIDSIHAGLPGGAGLEEVGGTAGVIGLLVPGAIFPLSFIALGIAMWRAGVTPRMSGPALAMAGVLFPMGNVPDIEAIALASDAMFAVALWPLGVAWLRKRRTEAVAGEFSAHNDRELASSVA
jgi:hypothetical protein